MLLQLEARRCVLPVVRFVNDGRRVKAVQQHAAWMLQLALSADFSRAHTLFELVPHDGIAEATVDLGARLDDVLIAQLKSDKFPPYKGIGISGERSAMFALVLRLVMAEQSMPRSFWADTEPYGLATVIRDLVDQLKVVVLRIVSAQKCEPSAGVTLASCSPERNAEKYEKTRFRGWCDPVNPRLSPDLDLWIVCGNVPVINMSHQGSPFSEHCSWLLQAAMGSDQKTTSLLSYITDYEKAKETREAYSECLKKVGLTPLAVGMVRLHGLGTQVLAVGATGKRSAMLSAVLAIAMQDENHLSDLEPQIHTMAPNLVEPFYELVQCCIDLREGRDQGRQDVRLKQGRSSNRGQSTDRGASRRPHSRPGPDERRREPDDLGRASRLLGGGPRDKKCESRSRSRGRR